MAVLSASDLQQLRQAAAKHLPVVQDAKATANAVFQAIEDYMVGSFSARPGGSLSAAINTAAGRTVAVEDRQTIWGVWARWKATNLGIN